MRAKALVWEGFETTGPLRLGISYGFNGGWTAHRWTEAMPVEIGKFATESEARAACQAEFERIWREMTDNTYTAAEFEDLRQALREPGYLTSPQAIAHAAIVMHHFCMREST